MSAFDVCGPLPTGVTVLEASAGTGKTYTIAALAARYVADGIPLHELLLVTFTRMATGELRERVRERLVDAERALARPELPAGADAVVRLLASGTPDEVEKRRAHLARALADFDAATIATIHGFCQEELAGLGVLAGGGEGELAEDITDLREEVVDDLFVQEFAPAGSPPFTRDEASRIARIAVENPTAPIAPGDGDGAQRRAFAERVREELEVRKRRAGIVTYDDLLLDLDRALANEAVAARLRDRYRVVLVDEFQDTDPVQWSIVRRAFGGGGSTLVLIGDPKQAIYAFRGADVYAYLDAAGAAGTRETLDVNRRSDQGLVDAYDALFGGAQLGHPGIVYRPVRATTANQRPRLHGAPESAPLRIRILHRDDPRVERTPRGYARTPSARAAIADDLAADVVRLLTSGATVERRTDDGATRDEEPVAPGHIAVLVQTNRAAAQVRDALADHGVPAVINGAGSVFATDPAREWLRLLEALERPSGATAARAAALTAFVGWDAERAATADELAVEDLHRDLHEWARVLREQGVAALLETVSTARDLPRRVLAVAGGERRLTDLRHVGQLLHAAAAAEHLGATALVAWLRRRIAEAGQDSGDEDRSRRLESDAQAVQVLTVHRSKGLEFAIVYYPALWEPGYAPDGPVAYHDPDAGDRRTIDVTCAGVAFRAHKDQAELERRGEDLRLAYVALTRAQHQAVVWWASAFNSRQSPLGQLLFRDGDGAKDPSDDVVEARFAALRDSAPRCIAVERVARGLKQEWPRPLAAAAALATARFDRTLDAGWRRTSYSDLTAVAHEERVGSEPEEPLPADEPAGPVPAATPGAVAPRTGADGGEAVPGAAPPRTGTDGSEAVPGAAPPRKGADGSEATLRAVPALLGGMPAGPAVGTFVHKVLEAADFAAPDLPAQLAAQIAAVHARGPLELGERAALVAGLAAVLETPLGPLAGDLRLRDVARADRLDELAFELPLAGGDTPAGRLTLAGIAALLEEHLPPGDPLAPYAARLADPALRDTVRGYVTGSLDLVLRAGGRYAIVDYKTNWLAAPGEPLTAWHHRPAALQAEMLRAHYGLQALLYTVALHRYLRWRVPGYDPDAHLAGVLYLFVRGMTGTDTPRVGGVPCGVFGWRPPGALVAALSDLLDRGSAA